MESVEEFLAYAIQLEQEATLRFGQLADVMDASGNREVGKLFRRLSDYSKLHLADAIARSGFREIPAMKPGDFIWPDLESPETAAIWAADPLIGREQALEIALAAETAGYRFYKTVTPHPIPRSRCLPGSSFLRRANMSQNSRSGSPRTRRESPCRPIASLGLPETRLIPKKSRRVRPSPAKVRRITAYFYINVRLFKK
jgi:hypothetical protein